MRDNEIELIWELRTEQNDDLKSLLLFEEATWSGNNSILACLSDFLFLLGCDDYFTIIENLITAQWEVLFLLLDHVDVTKVIEMITKLGAERNLGAFLNFVHLESRYEIEHTHHTITLQLS